MILDNVKADTLNLDSIDPSTSATLTTDKADYAPTDTAVITGTGFKSNHTYDLTIKSDDSPAISTTVEITTDDQGAFIYAYQLDGNYRPNYQVIVTNTSAIPAACHHEESCSPNNNMPTASVLTNRQPIRLLTRGAPS